MIDQDSSRALEFIALTLNCWGLFVVSKKRAQRIRLIADYLRSCSADIVFLQEVWVRKDADLIAEVAAQGDLKYSHHFVAGMFGSGLITLSRYPITEARFWGYTAAGDPLRFTNGDYYAGKGVGWARISTPIGNVDLFNSHLSANYEETRKGPENETLSVPEDSYASVRTAQIIQLAQFVRANVGLDSASVVLGGDLNSPPNSLEIAILQQRLPSLRDCWAEANPGIPGPTANRPDNTYSTAGAGKEPTRIDYVWVAGEVVAAEVTMVQSKLNFSFSDHAAMCATFKIQPLSDPGARPPERAPLPALQLAQAKISKEFAGGAAWGKHLQHTAKDTEPKQLIEELALQVMTKGMLTMRRGAGILARLSALMLVVSLGFLGVLLAYPWWRYPAALHTVLLVLSAFTWFALPIAFLFGYGARHGEGQALEEMVTEAQLILRRNVVPT